MVRVFSSCCRFRFDSELGLTNYLSIAVFLNPEFADPNESAKLAGTVSYR